VVLVFGFVFFFQGSVAQQAKRYSFTNYNVNNGLAAYHTTSIAQDAQGYIWIGTISGLQRFDGNRFLTFRHNPSDRKSIPDNNIIQLYYDKQKNLWVLFGNGKIGIFDTHRFTFTESKLELIDSNSVKGERKLVEDSDGNLAYVFHLREVATYHKGLNQFSYKHNIVRVPRKWKLVHFSEDIPTKKYYISTDSGLVVYNRRTKQMSYRGHNTENEAVIDQFGHISALPWLLVDRQSRFWFQHWPADEGLSFLYCFDLKSKQPLIQKHHFLQLVNRYHESKDILQQRNGTLWFSGLNLLARFNEHDKSFQAIPNGYTNAQGISYSRIFTLFEDREENIWVATNNNGLYVFNPSKQFFSSVKHLNPSTGQQGDGGVLSFMPMQNGDLMVGCWGDGIHRYDQNMNEIPVGIKPENVSRFSTWSMCRLNDNRTIWMGMQPGIFVYDENTGNGIYHDPPVLNKRTIRQLAQDRYGNIWIGTQSLGLFKWTASRAVNDFNAGFEKVENVPRTLIEKISIDSKGYVWICTMTHGVYKIDPASNEIAEHLTEDGPPQKKLFLNAAAAALEYNDSIMVIVTGAVNIYNTRSNTIRHITSTNGLPSDMVMSVEKDKNGFLWFGLLNGLCRINLEKNTFTYYDRNDGMLNDNFNLASSYILPDGKFVFGTSDDFILFNPDEIITTSNPPNVTVTDFKILNRSMMVDSLLELPKIELRYDQNSITIGYAGLSYLQKGKLVYDYMLEGIDKEWKRGNELNHAIYNYLPPGKYTFKVKAENPDGLSSKNITALVIRVYPPFWKSWWFYAILALCAIILLYGFDRERMRKKEAIHKMRSEIAGNLHQEINTALSNINILSEMAKLKAEKDPHRSKEYFEQIHTKSHNMIIAMDDMLWSINPENDSMSKTAERMTEYVDALKNRHQVNIDILVDKNVESLELNMKLRHDAFILFKDGIKTVIQAGAKNCKVHIGFEGSMLLYTMQFDNKGCDMQQLNNLFNSHDMENRLTSINARLKVQVHKSSSLFELELPVA
jgi:ligand-binding sensor domain-containing protein